MSETGGSKLGRNLLLVGRIALGLIFLVAAYQKMKPQAGMSWGLASIKTSLALFAMGVDSYQMLPPWAVSPLAHFIPPFELVLGLWLLSGIALRLSSLISTLAICVFVTAMFSAYERGLTISCGCFGPGEHVGPLTLLRDSALFLPLALALTIGSFWIRSKPRESAVPETVGTTPHTN